MATRDSTVVLDGARSHKWPAPKLVAKSRLANRADQGNKTLANEYLDSAKVLDQKMAVVADLIRHSSCCTAYTGAGLSKSAGIPDYGTKAENSVMARAFKIENPLDAEPTLAHRVLAALERRNLLKHYVQQNHDGLPQKAGFPQSKINEIHGGWFDPSNPGSLRHDLFEWMLEMEQKTDLCLCLGTSLSGMNADRMANTPAKRAAKGRGLGTVIINLQQTALDERATVRVWAKLDDAMAALARHLHLEVPSLAPPPLPPSSELLPNRTYLVPYNAEGRRDETCRMLLDLSQGAQVRVVAPGASNEGHVVGEDRETNLIVHIDNRYRIGRWWIHDAIAGALDQLPFVNAQPRFASVGPETSDSGASEPHSDDETWHDRLCNSVSHLERAKTEGSYGLMSPQTTAMESLALSPLDITPAPVVLPDYLEVVQSHFLVDRSRSGGPNCHRWAVQLGPTAQDVVEEVVWELHPTFSPSQVTTSEYPFSLSRIGWGYFEIVAHIRLNAALGGRVVRVAHMLSFETIGDPAGETRVALADTPDA